MEGQAQPPPPAEAPPDEEARPATLAEVRTLRRWLVVTGIWAVAASAIAIIALLESGSDEPTGPRNATVTQVSRVQRELDQRIDRLESQIEGLPRANDVSRLERRLKRVEDGASNIRDDVRDVDQQLDDLEQRVEDVEQQSTTPEAGADTETETTP